MARVCTELFPKGYYKGQKDHGFYMDDVLKANLDVLLKNASKKDDWDFVIIISGGGRVRIGKSMLALQIAQYWIYMLSKLYDIKTPFNFDENIVFHGKDLIEKGHEIYKKYSQGVIIFDEAGADLEGLKVIRKTTQAVKDYLRECGQYNFLTILVLPEFFDLPRGIAITRSDCLIDIYRSVNNEGKFIRGFFNFYSWPNKRELYLRGKKELNYKAWKYDFHGRFTKFYPIDEEKYRAAKLKALLSRKKEEEEKKDHRWKIQRDLIWKIILQNNLTTQGELVEFYKKCGINIDQTTISFAILNKNLPEIPPSAIPTRIRAQKIL